MSSRNESKMSMLLRIYASLIDYVNRAYNENSRLIMLPSVNSSLRHFELPEIKVDNLTLNLGEFNELLTVHFSKLIGELYEYK